MSKIEPIVVDAINMAIQMEKDGRAYYERAASQTENRLAEKMFENLAKDEIIHLQTFQKMFATITNTIEWQEIANNYSPKIGKLPIFQDDFKKQKQVNPDDLTVLRIAMENERKSVDFYTKTAKETSNTTAQQIFLKIVKEERYHYDLLQAQYDSLTNSGFWFDVAEFQMDGKF